MFRLLLVASSIMVAVWVVTSYLPRDSKTVSKKTAYKNFTTAQYISPISVDYLRSVEIKSKAPTFESEIPEGGNYKQYIASYLSEGNKVYGLLTVPTSTMPKDGFPAIVFNHGYIPPTQYVTTESYVAYVDYLARNGFVVFKIDFRGNGNSEGDASGSYFSSAYTIDVISALRSLQKFKSVNPDRIGMWGHSMAGNATLRAMLVTDEIRAGVIWAGAVYSYEDFAKYRISDTSYVHRPFLAKSGTAQRDREVSSEVQKIRTSPESIDFDSTFWNSISLTKNIKYLSRPLQIHHSTFYNIVNVSYSRDLVKVLKSNSKKYEFYEYESSDHNIGSPSFETAMERTVGFFKKNL
ncbi:MAG: alpha/beta fold hydrolase, partial [Patescibacteria group bacterium]